MSTLNTNFFNVITTKKDIHTQIAELKGQLARLERQAAAARWDALKTLPDKTVIRFNKTFGRSDSTVYTYGAIKIDGRWHLTDSGGRHHSAMAEFLNNGVMQVDEMTFSRPVRP